MLARLQQFASAARLPDVEALSVVTSQSDRSAIYERDVEADEVSNIKTLILWY